MNAPRIFAYSDTMRIDLLEVAAILIKESQFSNDDVTAIYLAQGDKIEIKLPKQVQADLIAAFDALRAK